MVKAPITAIVLAGGLATRMGGCDKGLLMLKGKPLYQHVIDGIKPQVDNIMINCNRNDAQYALSGYATFADDFAGYLGPLSGIYSGLLRSQTEWNVIVSCDTPFLPADLVARLFQYIENHQAAYAFDGERVHPTILLIHKNVMEKISDYLSQGDRKLMLFLQSIDAVKVDFSDKKQLFININKPDDLQGKNRYHE